MKAKKSESTVRRRGEMKQSVHNMGHFSFISFEVKDEENKTHNYT